MKKMILTALVAVMTGPAFAPASDTQETAFDTSSEQTMEMSHDEMMTPMAEEAEGDVEALQRFPWPFPRPYTCFSRDRFGRTYWGRDWNARRAANLSLRTCWQNNRWNRFARCQFIGCRRR